LLALVAATGVTGVNVDIENGVYALSEDNFDTVVKKFPSVMVKFYAPWCGHCKALAPVYEKAARKLKKEAEAIGNAAGGVRLAKVDAIAEQSLAAKYEVNSYPTMVVFKNGAVYGTYMGGRDKDDLVGYMSAMTAPAPIDLALRSYYISRSAYKEVLRLIFPGALRKHLFKAYPLVLATPFLIVMLCRVCCRSAPSSEAKKKVAAPKKKSNRASTPDPVEGKKKDAPQEKKERNETKGEGEKKDD